MTWPKTIDPSHTIYLGAMTGTSVDKQVDFTAAIFDHDGLLLHHQDATITLPAAVRDTLYHLSVTPCDQLTVAQRTAGEIAITDFMIGAYRDVIEQLGLQKHPKDKLILSPHGQTIDHQPKRHHTDQLLHGERLANATGYPVVFRHRQACIAVSDAAPLAPVLLRTGLLRRASSPPRNDEKKDPPPPRNDEKKDPGSTPGMTPSGADTVIVNGGGVANICIFTKGKTIAFDTGPANGPLEELISHIIATDPAAIPTDLCDSIKNADYDVDGLWAARGNINEAMYNHLMAHPYFSQQTTRKSADRAWFNLAWVLQARGDISWTDCVTTLATVIADSIAQAITAHVNSSELELGFYGGLRYNQAVMQRIKQQLDQYTIQWIDWDQLQLDPDFMESLLMAYLGFCVHQGKAVDLSYCATCPSPSLRGDAVDAAVQGAGLLRGARNDANIIPGLLVNPRTNHD